MQSLSLKQHVLNKKMPTIIDCVITPSECNTSKHDSKFFDLMDILGFGRDKIEDRVVELPGSISTEISSRLDYSFPWLSQVERASYEPLLEHLATNGISAKIVSDGGSLPGGRLYREELCTLKKSVKLCSIDLRKEGKEPIIKYIFQGRTDLVRTRVSDGALGKSNNRFFIEIKKGPISEMDFREAVLQLIGGNSSNTFHSPPVLLTNLETHHYVLYITLVGDPTVVL
jgi:hypothetical protein